MKTETTAPLCYQHKRSFTPDPVRHGAAVQCNAYGNASGVKAATRRAAPRQIRRERTLSCVQGSSPGQTKWGGRVHPSPPGGNAPGCAIHLNAAAVCLSRVSLALQLDVTVYVVIVVDLLYRQSAWLAYTNSLCLLGTRCSYVFVDSTSLVLAG